MKADSPGLLEGSSSRGPGSRSRGARFAAGDSNGERREARGASALMAGKCKRRTDGHRAGPGTPEHGAHYDTGAAQPTLRRPIHPRAILAPPRPPLAPALWCSDQSIYSALVVAGWRTPTSVKITARLGNSLNK